MRTINTMLGLLLLTTLLMPVGCNWRGDSPYKARTSMLSSAAHLAQQGLLIDTRNGSVDVASDSSVTEVTIEADVRCGGMTQQEADDRLAATTLEVMRDENNTLVIRPIFPEPKRSADAASLVIRVPDASGVNIDTSNGAITVAGLAGAMYADTSNGSITITDHQGDAQLDTSNGRVTVKRHTGTLIVDTSNGSIDLSDISGAVEADTSNGSITVSLTDAQTGPVRLDTSNASIRLEVGPAFVGEIALSTSNGGVSVEDAAGRVRQSNLKRSGGSVHLGEGGERSVLDSSNGNIKVVIREES